MSCHLCVVSTDEEIKGNDIGRLPYLSHESLLRRADYTCSGVRPPSVSRADVKLEFDVVDAHPRLYAKYTCHDGLALKDRSRQFMYCLDRKWIGVLPTCVIGRPYYNGVLHIHIHTYITYIGHYLFNKKFAKPTLNMKNI